ncbi:MAG: protein phosphatase 2C domain-containing protein [Hyphomicrobium sp.]|jgi:protein phosphatase
MSMLVAGAARATIGSRATQEDSFQLWPPAASALVTKGEELLCIVADGMGGHAAGEVAAGLAAQAFVESFATDTRGNDERLGASLEKSNAAIAARSNDDGNTRGMGCTLVAAAIDGRGVTWVSVGDSLLLLYRHPNVLRLNADHSLGAFLDEQVRRNALTEREAQRNPHRHALRSALTGKELDLIDLEADPYELQDGDWLLLASDGIASLTGDEIGDIAYANKDAQPQVMADRLVEAVVGKGRIDQDNTTVVAVRVTKIAVEVDPSEAPTRIKQAAPEGGEVSSLAELPTRRVLLPAASAGVGLANLPMVIACVCAVAAALIIWLV